MLLAFDLGTNSAGWCLFEVDSSLQPTRILDAGVRIFSDGREPKSGNSLAEGRRVARGMSKRRDRYKRRRKAVLRTLTDYGMMPADPRARADLVAETGDRKTGELPQDVYSLRKRALDEKLSLLHLGRALFHLQQRRGFKSNRKTDRKSNEAGEIAQGTARLDTAMRAAGARTLGEFLADRRGVDPLNRGNVRVRRDAESALAGDSSEYFYPERRMLEDEFRRIWDAQAIHWPEILTDDRKAHLFRVMFYQRPLKPAIVGKCSFNPDELRLAKAHPLFQEFRLYKEVNELRLVYPDQSERPLTPDQRDELIHKLRSTRSAAFTALRKTLKLSSTGARFNKESEGRDKLLGDEIYPVMSDKAIFGNRWPDLSTERQWEIISRLRDEADPLTLHQWLVERAGLSDEAAEKAADARLPDGYGRLGLTAISEMLVHLKANVIPEAEAAKLCGYDHALQREGDGYSELPKYQEVLERRIPPGTGNPDDAYDVRKGRITNPTVHIALNQLRALTNAIVKRHGRPERIHIELARELNQSEDQKREANIRNAKNRRDAERRSGILQEFAQPDNGFNRQLLKQWEELNPDPQNRRCIYTGTVISARMLFSGEVDIDHILPWSRTLDDSPANRILCTREANRIKGNHAPAEVPIWTEHYDDIVGRAQNLPQNKRWRFAKDAMARFEKDRDFLDRQLTDTQYLARLAHDYLGSLYPDEEPDGDGVLKRRNHVVVVTGKMTEMLRRKWQLNSILWDHNYGDVAKPKNRKDHRHHAIDAAVIGATSRSLLKRIADAARQGEEQGVEDVIRTIQPPWPTFRDDLKTAIQQVVVSYKPDHGTLPKPGRGGATAGQLHNDTAYGLTNDVDARGNPVVVRRKAFLGLQPKDLETIRDSDLRSRLQQETFGLSGKDFTNALIRFRRKETPFKRIRHVRVTEGLSVIPIRDANGRAYKGYKGDANFRYDVWELPDGQWKADVVTMFDAHRSDLDWSKRRPHPAARKVLSLKQGDMVAFDHPRSGATVGTVVKFGQNGQITLVPHHEAGDLKRRDALPNSEEEALAKGAESGGEIEFDPFKYYAPTAGGLKKIRLRQIRVDETGKVFDPGPQDRESRNRSC